MFTNVWVEGLVFDEMCDPGRPYVPRIQKRLCTLWFKMVPSSLLASFYDGLVASSPTCGWCISSCVKTPDGHLCSVGEDTCLNRQMVDM